MAIVYHPNHVLRLGATFDTEESDIDKTTVGYIDWVPDAVTQTVPVVAEISLEATEAASQSSVFEAIGIDLNTEARIGLGSGSASYSKLSQLQFSDRSTTFIVHVSKIFSPNTISGRLRLSELGQKRLEMAASSDRLIEFRRLIGSHFITQTQSGVSISVVYQIHASESSRLNSLRAAFNMEYSGTGSASGSLSKQLICIDSGAQFSVFAVQLGASSAQQDTIERLLLPSSNDLSKVKQIISDAIRAATIESAVVLRANGTPIGNIDDVVWTVGNKFQVAERTMQAMSILTNSRFAALVAYQNALATVDSILRETPLSLLIEGAFDELSILRKEYETNLASIIKDHKSLDPLTFSSERPPRVPEYPKQLVAPRYLKKPFVICEEWLASACTDYRGAPDCENFEFANFYQSFSPRLLVVHPSYVERVLLLKFGQPVLILGRKELSGLQESGGGLQNLYRSSHTRTNVYTHGAIFLEGTREECSKSFKADEYGAQYSLEITDTTGSIHRVDIGSYGRKRNDIISDTKALEVRFVD